MIRGASTLVALALTLVSCAPVEERAPEVERLEPAPLADLPAMRTFGRPNPASVVRSNASIARDFLELTFRLESGRALDRLTRFEEPISVRLRGPASASVDRELSALLSRLREEAKIDIRRTAAPDAPANVTVEIVDRQEMRDIVPKAACFVVPRMSSWDEFRRNRRSRELDWTTLQRRERVAVFIPAGIAPQESRDCLHEELAQAIGPLNDLYRLTDSVFNDDNFHNVLTGFDMLVLRATYAPTLASGMSETEVAGRLPALLARINPDGDVAAPPPPSPTTDAWRDAIGEALGPELSETRRRRAARRALHLTQEAGWDDNRRAFTLYVLARLNVPEAPGLALGAFLEAAEYYHRRPETQLHAAHIGLQMAALALSAGDAEAARRIVDRYLEAARRGQNGALLSTLLMVEAEALELQGRAADAAASREEAFGWALYGFGSEAEARMRAAEIRTLVPQGETRS